MASAPETNVSQESQDPTAGPKEDLITRFVLKTAKVLFENGRLQDFPYMAKRSADLLDGNKILKQILSKITSKCDAKTAYKEMQKYMYRLVLEELLTKASVDFASMLVSRVALNMVLPATMEYLVPYNNAITQELQPGKIANELKAKLDEYTHCMEIHGEASDYNNAMGVRYEKALAISTELGFQFGIGNENSTLISEYFCMARIEDFNKSLTANVKIGNQSGIAESNQYLGKVYFELERFEESIDYFKKSLDIYRELQNQKEIANSSEKLGIAYFELGKNEESIGYFKECLDMYTKLENQEGMANTIKNLGNLYLTIKQYEQSSRYLKMSLEVYTKMGNELGIANSNSHFAHLCFHTNQPKKAIEYYKKSIAVRTGIRTEMHERQSEIASDNSNLGVVYNSVGEYEKAITHFKTAIRISVDKSKQASYYRNLGDVYTELERYKKAIPYYEKAKEISIEIGDSSEMTHAYAGLGMTHRGIKKFDKAMEYYEKALVIAPKIRDLRNRNEITRIITGNMGNVYLEQEKREKASEYHKRSLALSIEIGHQSGMALSNARLGDICVRSANVEEAISYYEKGIEISSLIKDQKTETKCLAGLGVCYYFIHLLQLRSGLEPLKQAISYYRKAIECSDSIFLKLHDDENQTSFTQQYDRCYFFMSCCFISLERFEAALLVADLGKAKTLQISVGKRSSEADYARKTWQAIDDEKEQYRTADISKAIQLEKDCATVLYYLFDYMGILKVWVFNCDHGKIDRLLGRKDCIHASLSELLNYFNVTIDKRSSFFRTMRDVVEVDLAKLSQEPNADNEVFRNETPARAPMKNQNLGKEAQTKKHLRDLFLALIKPIQEFIKGTKLIIIPDDFLFFAPFSALLDEKGLYLSEKYSIQITPSLQTLYSSMLQVSEPASELGPALFVGNPSVGDIKFEGELRKLPPIPNATKEVAYLASLLDARPLTEYEAMKSRVLDRISDSSIIHIAAHGDKLRGEIYLSPNPEWIQQGFDLPTEKFYLLQQRDIVSMAIKARLVVLSCCNTGAGNTTAEGVIGLARSFLSAGAQSVLATLWPINDEATKLFMEKFYDELLKGVSVCEALKAVMNVFRRHEKGFCRSFSIWAPFTIIGKDVRFSREDIEKIKRKSREKN